MQFLKTLFWVLLAVIITSFAWGNWSDVTLNLWGDIQLDIKIPVLMLAMFLLGFLPLFLIHRARLRTVRRRVEARERAQPRTPVSAEPPQSDEFPAI